MTAAMPTDCLADPPAPLRPLSASELMALDQPAARPIATAAGARCCRSCCICAGWVPPCCRSTTPAAAAARAGARFDLHIEKARHLHGDALAPLAVRLEADASGAAQWHWHPALTSDLDRVAALLKEGLNPNQIARKLGISKSKAYRLGGQVRRQN